MEATIVLDGVEVDPRDHRPLTSTTDSVAVPGSARDVTLTNGTQKALLHGAAKGSTVAADVTSTPVDANTQALDVSIKNTSLAVTGAFFQVTQPVSGTVAISNLPATQPISATILPLPINAATSAKQPALGTAGSASIDVLTVQGISGMTAIKTDGSAVTQPVSGTITANAGTGTFAVGGTVTANVGTTNGLALDSTLTGGTQKAIVRSGAKGSATASDVTSTNVDANTQALDVSIKNISLPVTGAFFQATQPVSGTVGVSNFPASQAVTGPLTDTQLRATAVPVTGTFFQSTQPVSGTVTANIGSSGSLALDATLTGGTQKAIVRSAAKGTTTAGDVTSTPVDANTQALDVSVKGTVPVSGTFFQATQPVSGTVAVSNFPATQTINFAPAASLAVTGTFFQATQPVSLTTLPALVTGAAIIGKVGIDQTTPGTTNLVQVGGSLPTGTNSIGTIQPPAITKGTQGATGVSTQDLKDAGRNQTNYYMPIQIVSTATDALLALTGYKSGALVAATTTPAVVTAGKTYRIQSLTLTYVTIVTTPGAIRFSLRANTSGVVAITSPIVGNWTVGEPTGIAPVAGKFNTVTIPFPDGLEFAAGTGIGISQVGIGATGAAAVVGYGIVSINGYEY